MVVLNEAYFAPYRFLKLRVVETLEEKASFITKNLWFEEKNFWDRKACGLHKLGRWGDVMHASWVGNLGWDSINFGFGPSPTWATCRGQEPIWR